MSRLMDPRDKNGVWPFDYTPSVETDVRETFKRARQRIEEEKKRDRLIAEEKLRKTIAIRRNK